MWDQFALLTCKELFEKYPYTPDFFALLPTVENPAVLTVEGYFNSLPEEALQDLGIEAATLQQQFCSFMKQMEALKTEDAPITSITIIGGQDKSGKPENVTLTIEAGEIICVVGPTGSGKSRLLADIEWVAQQDTPTKRRILINGQTPDSKYRFSIEHKLVAQLSQNMNFIMDLSVTEFITMHAESRMINNIEQVAAGIIAKANELAGEKFAADTPVTALSGGQSRALMIADTAYLSTSPIVLIDEIENAGIDRQNALRLLVDKQKIVLMATHDPILALMGSKRIVIKNGGIAKVIETSPQEQQNLASLEAMDRKLSQIREALRNGQLIENLES